MTRFAKAAWLTVGVTLFVILWGAVVRATGSGAGCGNNWPTCNGEVLPLSGSAETAIEFIHRITSAGLGLLIVALVVMARRRFGAGHRVRGAAGATLILVIVESLVGAGLVLFEQTGDFEGVSRAYWQAGHFVNTMLLLAAATLTAWWATVGPAQHDGVATPAERRWIGAVGVAMLMVGVSGAIAALGERELSASGHIFERLRIYHPAIAIIAGLLAVWVANRLGEGRPGRVDRAARIISLLVFVQLAVGTVNVLLAAPVWIQIVHLLLADLVWMAMVVVAADVLMPARTKVKT